MRVRFWGVRGSIPTPLSSAAIEAKLVQAIQRIPPHLDVRDREAVQAYVASLPALLRGTAGSNTACVEVRSGETVLILDAGSGLRELGLDLMRGPCGRGQGTIHLLFSHPHWDHIQGFPFFAPAFIPGNRLIFYSIHDLELALNEQQRFLFFPISIDYMRATKEFVRLVEGHPFTIDGLQIDTLRNAHPGDAYSYRISDGQRTFVYATDAEYPDLSPEALQPRIEFIRNADAMVFDAQYTLREAWQKVDWGHSSAMIGVDLARMAGVRRLILFHHDPACSDEQLEAIRVNALAYQDQDPGRPGTEILIGCEGLTVDLMPAGQFDLRALADGRAVLAGGGDGPAALVSAGHAHTGDTFVDLSRVATLTTTDLKALVALGRAHSDGPLVLISPSPAVQQVIRLGGYADFFAVYPSLAAAQEAAQLRAVLNLPGHLLKGRYRIEAAAGSNRLGTTLRATDTVLGLPVAIKVLWPAFAETTISALFRQVSQYARLEHPHLRRVYEVERDGSVAFIVHEWLAGMRTLAERYAAGRVPLDEAIAIALAIARGLQVLHSHGMVHGDLQPATVFLTERGTLLSFTGAGRLEEGRTLVDEPLLLLNAAYLAPEQILGQPLDARSDLYALGVVLFELFTGQRPFAGDDAALLQAHLELAPPQPRSLNPALSPSLEHLVLKLLAKNPNARYAGVHQVAQILDNLALGLAEESQPPVLLAGRTPQRAALLRAWEQVRSGRGRLVFISGEPGVGKSTLARQTALESGAPVVLIGSCPDQPTAPAYAVFAQALSSYFASAPPELHDESLRGDLAVLARLAPAIGRLVPDLPALPPLDPRQEQLRLMISLTRVVQRASMQRLWLMVLEDLHWADSGSLELLHALARRLPECRLLLIGTYDAGDMQPNHPLREALRDLARHPTYEQVELDRLDEAGVGEMLAQIWQGEVPAAVVAQIYRHTEGNPLYVEALARTLVDEGRVPLESTSLLQLPDELQLPANVYDAVMRRVSRLGADTQDLLSHAAVLGATFSLETLRVMTGMDEGDLLDHLDAALERHIVREHGRQGELSFSNAEFRSALYAALGTVRRRRLHSQAARAIERLTEGMSERFAAELAYHYGEAGQIGEALRYSLVAAHQAAGDHANESALRWYRRVLSLAAALDTSARARRYTASLQAFEGLGAVLSLIGRWADAQAACEEALAFAQDEQDREAAARLQTRIAELLRLQGDYVQAEARLDLAEQDAAALDHQVALAHVFNRRGTLALARGATGAAVTFFTRSLDLYRQAGDLAEVARLSNNLGLACRMRHDYPQARALYLTGLDLARQVQNRQLEALLLANLGQLETLDGQYTEARAHLEAALASAREIGDVARVADCMHTLGTAARERGELELALAHYRESVAIFRELNDTANLTRLLDDLAMLAVAAGNAALAIQLAGVAAQARQQAGTVLPEDEARRLCQILEPAAATLEPGRLAAAQAAAAQTGFDAALALALEALQVVGTSPG